MIHSDEEKMIPINSTRDEIYENLDWQIWKINFSFTYLIFCFSKTPIFSFFNYGIFVQ